jgi:hypothetical protein
MSEYLHKADYDCGSSDNISCFVVIFFCASFVLMGWGCKEQIVRVRKEHRAAYRGWVKITKMEHITYEEWEGMKRSGTLPEIPSLVVEK